MGLQLRMHEWNESNASDEPNPRPPRPTPRTDRPNLRPGRCTLTPVRREPGGNPDRPKLTLIEGGRSVEEVEAPRVAVTRRGRRFPHPAGSGLEPEPTTDGPEAV
jgi:hypothetical protein